MVKADNYLLEKRNFDFVQVRNTHGYCGILLPIFKQQRNVERFEFAIDLGTSNTHIEFRKGNENQRFLLSRLRIDSYVRCSSL